MPSKILHEIVLEGGVICTFMAGSVLDFEGDAIVNACNEGGVTGVDGVDVAINKACGDFEIKEERKKFRGIKVGESKISSSFKHTKVKHIIHSVGPVYRENELKKLKGIALSIEEKDKLLSQAYESAIDCAIENGLTSIGFCLLSAGVFRGERPLQDIVDIAVQAVVGRAKPPLTRVAIYAYKLEEQTCLGNIIKK